MASAETSQAPGVLPSVTSDRRKTRDLSRGARTRPHAGQTTSRDIRARVNEPGHGAVPSWTSAARWLPPFLATKPAPPPLRQRAAARATEGLGRRASRMHSACQNRGGRPLQPFCAPVRIAGGGRCSPTARLSESRGAAAAALLRARRGKGAGVGAGGLGELWG